MRSPLSRLRRVAGAVVLAGACAATVLTVPGAASAQSLSDARAEASRLRAELADLKAQSAQSILLLESAEDALAGAVTRSVALQRELEAARAAAEGSGSQLDRRVSALYRSGGSVGLWASLLRARDPQDLASRKANVDAVIATDRRLRDVAVDGSGRVAVLEAEARRTAAEQTRAAAAAADEAGRVNALLLRQSAALASASTRVQALVEQERRAAAAAAARRLAEEQAAARAAALRAAAERAAALRLAAAEPAAGPVPVDVAAPPQLTAGGRASCPVGPVHSFTDTWHAPRSGGRKHQGTDVFAPYGAPAYAVVDGVIDKEGDGGLGGITLWLRADNGDRFYYAHNSRNVARVGQRVRAGELIAHVGTTGNAATTPPHIHFEAHPGGGAAVNPYAWLAALCAG